MPSFSPLKLLVFPFVFLVALPLALCAGATTILAFLVLFLRLFLVYFDLGLETARHIVVGHNTKNDRRGAMSRGTYAFTPGSSTGPTPIPSPGVTAFRHRRRVKRPGSGGGSGSITPLSGLDGVYGVVSGLGLERDFEGIGGWRVEGTHEQQWYSLNSRLENPYRRHHFRSQSGGAVMSGPATPRIVTESGSMTGSHSPERPRPILGLSRPYLKIPSIDKTQGFTRAG